jgi:hypothetical protein
MDPAVGPVATAILVFVAFVVPFVVIFFDDRAWHRAVHEV